MPAMFETETTLNQFLVQSFQQVMADIPEDRVNERPAGDGHPPLWILGHLAICSELGTQLLGGELQHKNWAIAFGPQSSDEVRNPEKYSASEFVSAITNGYPKLCEAAAQASNDHLSEPHGLELLANTPIQTRGQLVAHLLTTHFSFHLAQLSSWRRAAGHKFLF